MEAAGSAGASEYTGQGCRGQCRGQCVGVLYWSGPDGLARGGERHGLQLKPATRMPLQGCTGMRDVVILSNIRC